MLEIASLGSGSDTVFASGFPADGAKRRDGDVPFGGRPKLRRVTGSSHASDQRISLSSAIVDLHNSIFIGRWVLGNFASVRGLALPSPPSARPEELLVGLTRPRVSGRGSVRSSCRRCCETFSRAAQRRLPKCGNINPPHT
jgi:hypothetical protein